MQFRIVLLLGALCFPTAALSQQPALPAQSQGAAQAELRSNSPAAQPNLKIAAPVSPLQQFAAKQFGPDFNVDAHFEPMRADLDGDGAEDLVMIATSKHPLGGSGAFNYRVVDPYDSYFGIGDPKITTQFSNFGDGSDHCILIIHDWKAATPKAKWVIINVPFEKIALGQVTLKKKKTVAAVAAIEHDGLSSLVYYDGRKYKWEPSGFADEAEN